MFGFLKKLFSKNNNNEAIKLANEQKNLAPPMAGVANVTFFGRTLPQEQLKIMKTPELAACFLEGQSILKLNVVEQLNDKRDFQTYLDKNPRFFQKTAYELFEIAKVSKNTNVTAGILVTLNKKPLFSFFSNPVEQFLQKNSKFIALAGEEVFSNHQLQNLQLEMLKKLNKKTDHQICALLGENANLVMGLWNRVASEDKYINIKKAIEVWRKRPAPKNIKGPTSIFYDACADNNFHLIQKVYPEVEWKTVSKEYLQSLYDKSNLQDFSDNCPGLLKRVSNLLILKGDKAANDFFKPLDVYPNVKRQMGLPDIKHVDKNPESALIKMTQV